MRRNGIRRDTPQIETLTPARDRGRQFLRLGRGKNEFHMLGRFLQRFEQGIEGTGAEHVDFVDQVDLAGSAAGRIGGVVPEFANIFHAIVAGAIDFQNIKATALRDFLAGIAFPTGRGGGPLLAIQRLGQNAGRGRLADPPWTHEKIGLSDPSGGNGILQGAGDVFLPDHFFKGPGTVFSGKNAVAHGERISRMAEVGSRKLISHNSLVEEIEGLTGQPAQAGE